jgi:uncharacterized protein YecE (DUF72 family)
VIRIGPAGWSYVDWEGVVYPRKKPPGFHPLRYLAQYVDCIELNSSFYGTPRADYAAKWLEHVRDRPHFRFTAKLQDIFTHHSFRDSMRLREEADRFRAGLAPLREAGRLAGLLVQFPFSFRPTPGAKRRLEWIAETFLDHSLILEVRHKDWFEPGARDRIAGMGYNLASIDLPDHKDHPPHTVEPTGPLGYLRLHGRNRAAWFDSAAGRDQRYDYLYGKEEVLRLAETARRIAGGTEAVYVITNNHFSGKAVANVLELRSEIEGVAPRAPHELVLEYPRLKKVTRPDGGQSTLFDD